MKERDIRRIKRQVKDPGFTFCEEYDAALIGTTEDGRAIYDYDRCAVITAQENGISITAAEYWVDIEQAAGDSQFVKGSPVIIKAEA